MRLLMNLTASQRLCMDHFSLRVVANDSENWIKHLFFAGMIFVYSVVAWVIIAEETILTGAAVLLMAVAQLWSYRYVYLPIVDRESMVLELQDGVLTYRDGRKEIMLLVENIRGIQCLDYGVGGAPGEREIILTVERESAMEQPVLDHLLPQMDGRCVKLVINTLSLNYRDYITLCRKLVSLIDRKQHMSLYGSPFEMQAMWER